MENDYLLGWYKWRSDWETFGGLYGITLSKEDIPFIEKMRQDREEIGAILLYSELKKGKENVDEIKEKLLEFY